MFDMASSLFCDIVRLTSNILSHFVSILSTSIHLIRVMSQNPLFVFVILTIFSHFRSLKFTKNLLKHGFEPQKITVLHKKEPPYVCVGGSPSPRTIQQFSLKQAVACILFYRILKCLFPLVQASDGCSPSYISNAAASPPVPSPGHAPQFRPQLHDVSRSFPAAERYGSLRSAYPRSG